MYILNMGLSIFDYPNPLFSHQETNFFYFLAGVLMVIIIGLLYFYGQKLFWKNQAEKKSPEIEALCQHPGVIIGNMSREDLAHEEVSHTEADSFGKNPSNFLHLEYAIENQLRMLASQLTKKEFNIASNQDEVDRIIKENEYVTGNGIKKLEHIRWLRDQIVEGRVDYISSNVLDKGVHIAWEFHRELNILMRRLMEKQTKAV